MNGKRGSARETFAKYWEEESGKEETDMQIE